MVTKSAGKVTVYTSQGIHSHNNDNDNENCIAIRWHCQTTSGLGGIKISWPPAYIYVASEHITTRSHAPVDGRSAHNLQVWTDRFMDVLYPEDLSFSVRPLSRSAKLRKEGRTVATRTSALYNRINIRNPFIWVWPIKREGHPFNLRPYIIRFTATARIIIMSSQQYVAKQNYLHCMYTISRASVNTCRLACA